MGEMTEEKQAGFPKEQMLSRDHKLHHTLASVGSSGLLSPSETGTKDSSYMVFSMYLRLGLTESNESGNVYDVLSISMKVEALQVDRFGQTGGIKCCCIQSLCREEEILKSCCTSFQSLSVNSF